MRSALDQLAILCDRLDQSRVFWTVMGGGFLALYALDIVQWIGSFPR